MSAAEFFAASLRIYLWTKGQLDVLQKEMALKNVLFLLSVEGAYDMWMNSTTRAWNSREIGCGVKYPDREVQLRYLKWTFVVFYVLEGILLSLVLLNAKDWDCMHGLHDSVSGKEKECSSGKEWVANIALDLILVAVFLLYCSNTHVQSVNNNHTFWLCPQKTFVIFPATMAAIISILLACSLWLARVPSIYFSENILVHALLSDPGIWWSYGNALLIVTLSVLPIACLALFWSISYMVFRKEFTGRYTRSYAMRPKAKKHTFKRLGHSCVNTHAKSYINAHDHISIPLQINLTSTYIYTHTYTHTPPTHTPHTHIRTL